jgi:two-component system sensor histidine kinase RegB
MAAGGRRRHAAFGRITLASRVLGRDTCGMARPSLTDMFNPEARGHWVRLRTLMNLRWVAAAGQAFAVLSAYFGFGLDLPLGLCLAVIAAPVAVNLVAWRRHPAAKRLSERDAMLSLLFDLGQVSLLLALTGGLTNPFAVLLLAPVTIAASVLTLRSTLILASAAMAFTTAMLVYHHPLAFRDGAAMRPPDVYLLGLWAALTLGIAFMALYTRRIGVETARMAEALAAAQLALSREQRLTAIGALAAAAAHELGTPLATIKLISGELARDLRDRPEHAEDLALLRAQADRCREILRDLSEGGREDAHVRHAPIAAVIDEAARPHRGRGKAIVVRINGRPAEEAGDAQPMVTRRPEIIHGLRNLVQNAVDFAQTTIWVDVREREATLRVSVGDDGPGFKPEVLDMLGDPYVTTRGRNRPRGEKDGDYQGMGLGLFISKTLLERTGARIVFTNGAAATAAERAATRPGDGPPGAIVAAIWPRDAIVARRSATREALGENPRFSA